MQNGIKKGDIFINEQFAMRYRIMDFIHSDKILCEYTRNGTTIQRAFEGGKLASSLLNKDLFVKRQQLTFDTDIPY